jgi:hypothetical protein
MTERASPRNDSADGAAVASKIAFIHVPKTAGTSFTRALAQGWPRVRIIASAAEVNAVTPAELDGLDLLAGHFNAFQIDGPRFNAFRKVTVLRDPFARLVSSYRYARNMVLAHGIEGTPQMRFAARASLAEYAFSVHGVQDRHGQLYNLGRIAGENPHDVRLSELLERATARLDQIEVGIAEDLDPFVRDLFARNGRGAPVAIERLNTAVTDDEGEGEDLLALTERQFEALREIMAPDYALYEHARQLQSRRLGQPVRAVAPEAAMKAVTITPSAARAPLVPPRMLVGTFHKSGTILMLSIMRKIANQLGYKLWVPNRNPPPAEWDILFHAHSNFSPEVREKPHRGVIVIRDPRDVIISGAFYHARPDSDRDPWLYVPDEKLGGRSYHDAIAAQPTDAAKFLFEMDNFGKRTMFNMRRHLDLSRDFIRVRFEDLTTDVELREFRRLFAWLGIREADMDKALAIAEQSSLFSGQVTTKHVRSGKPAQWRQHFTPELHTEFRRRFGDLAERLGYPAA